MIRIHSKVTERHKSAFRVLIASLSLLALLFLGGCGGLGPANLSTSDGFDFSISLSPGSQTVVAGKSTLFTIAENPAAVIGITNFSVSGLPSGVQATFTSPLSNPLGSTSLLIETTETTPTSSSQLTITANDGTHTHTAKVNLTVTPPANFTLSATPGSQSLTAGGSTSFNVNVNYGNNAAGTASLSVSGLPSGVTAAFNPATVTGTGQTVLTLSASGFAQSFNGSFTISATDSSGSYFITVGLIVTPADFTLEQSLGSVTLTDGNTITNAVSVNQLSHPSAVVTLSVAGVPSGMTATFNPSPVTGSGNSTLTITTTSSTTLGTFTLVLQGFDASGDFALDFPVTVGVGNPAAGFDLYAVPSTLEVVAGNTATYSLYATTASGPLPALTYNASAGSVTATISPNGSSGAYVLNVDTSNLDNIDYTTQVLMTATFTGPNGSQSLDVNLIIDPQPPPPPPPDPDPSS